ncbi:NUDIX domain-containing protein [Actinomadura sp. BRA 177]|uniref:NUDIX hydrolase n=1 Tax=Actinomadura sp. BRA 177 TaxID=2745202 RepID=UPI0015958919|nr:NUDIX domain-containing protein [Actinomadura sp. BRA 177]NVI87835.1 NUDIX domain-containing protein [Actinomadura sp. BRA 177]
MGGTSDGFVFDTKHDRYPVAAHIILTRTDGRVLLMRRAGSGYADGQLALPAGHVDLGETPTDSIAREVNEELGLVLAPVDISPAGVMFRRSLEPRVDFFFTTASWDGTPRIREPHKCTELVWAAPDDMPVDALAYVSRALTNAKQGIDYCEYGWVPEGV